MEMVSSVSSSKGVPSARRCVRAGMRATKMEKERGVSLGQCEAKKWLSWPKGRSVSEEAEAFSSLPEEDDEESSLGGFVG